MLTLSNFTIYKINTAKKGIQQQNFFLTTEASGAALFIPRKKIVRLDLANLLAVKDICLPADLSGYNSICNHSVIDNKWHNTSRGIILCGLARRNKEKILKWWDNISTFSLAKGVAT